MQSTTDLIIGAGEIGTALFEVLKHYYLVKLVDKNSPKIREKVRVMHICFPCQDQKEFVGWVKKYQEKYEPEFTVIHSTVPVGTTGKCGEKVFHSPVRGVHPRLQEALLTFAKYLAPPNEKLKEYLQD